MTLHLADDVREIALDPIRDDKLAIHAHAGRIAGALKLMLVAHPTRLDDIRPLCQQALDEFDEWRGQKT